MHNRGMATKRQRRVTTRVHLPVVVAVYACGHRVVLVPRGDAELECACSRHAPLQGFVRAA